MSRHRIRFWLTFRLEDGGWWMDGDWSDEGHMMTRVKTMWCTVYSLATHLPLAACGVTGGLYAILLPIPDKD